MPEERVVGVTVKAVAIEEDGHKMSFDIPAFASQYPIDVYKVPEEDAKSLKKNTAANVVLRKGTVKKDKGGKVQDGTKDWHYWWNWVRLAKGDEDVAESPVPETHAPARQDRDTGRSIEQQVALKAAVEFHKELTRARAQHYQEGDVFDILETATWFARWLYNPKLTMSRIIQRQQEANTAGAGMTSDQDTAGQTTQQEEAPNDLPW